MSRSCLLGALLAGACALSCSAKEPAPAVEAEIEARERFARAVARDAGTGRALTVGSREDVLFAIRNGGFSGAIMPANIVVGEDARDIALFLERYAGAQSDTGK